MSNKYLEILTHVVRHPRHPVHKTEQVAISIERGQALPASDAAPEVIDFSRGGCRLRWRNALQKNEPIVLWITDRASGLSLKVAGTIRWSRSAGEKLWEAGCQFDDDLDYEHLGELFIAGFLDAELTAAS